MAWILATVALGWFQAGSVDVRERVDVEYVLLDVVAVDRHNRLVTDLTLEDFKLTENKKPQPLRKPAMENRRNSRPRQRGSGRSSSWRSISRRCACPRPTGPSASWNVCSAPSW